MSGASEFMLRPYGLPWLGGEPRVFAVDIEDNFPEGLASVKETVFLDISYETGGLTGLLDRITEAAGVIAGSFQAVLENLENLCHEKPLVICVRGVDRLLADVGPAVIHFIAGWEGFTHHALERFRAGQNRYGDSQRAASQIQDAGWNGGRHG